ncbi:uncharacterized protein LOC144351877 [Saccoglossus kowalevskii]
MFLYQDPRMNNRQTVRASKSAGIPEFLVTNAGRRVGESAKGTPLPHYRNDDEGLVRVSSSTNARPLGILRDSGSSTPRARPRVNRPRTAGFDFLRDGVRTTTRQRLAEYARKHHLEICVTGIQSLTPRKQVQKQRDNESSNCVFLLNADHDKYAKGIIGDRVLESGCVSSRFYSPTNTHQDTNYRARRCQSSRSPRFSDPTQQYLKRATSADPRWRHLIKSQRINAALVAESSTDLDDQSVVSTSTNSSSHIEQCTYDDSDPPQRKMTNSTTKTSPTKRTNGALTANVLSRKNSPESYSYKGQASEYVSLSTQKRPASAVRHSLHPSSSVGSLPKWRERPQSAPPTNNNLKMKKLFRMADNILDGMTPVGFESLKIDSRQGSGTVCCSSANSMNRNRNGVTTSTHSITTQRHQVALSGKLRSSDPGRKGRVVNNEEGDFDEDQMLINLDYLQDSCQTVENHSSNDPIVTYNYANHQNGMRTYNKPSHIKEESDYADRQRDDPNKQSVHAGYGASDDEKIQNGELSEYYSNHWHNNNDDDADNDGGDSTQNRHIVLPHCVNCPCAKNEDDHDLVSCPPPPNSPDLPSEDNLSD